MDAVEIMTKAVAGEGTIQVVTCKVMYPQGAEKMLIKACVDREVPARGLPMDCGVVCQNIGTAVAIYEAARFGKPLIERVVTVTGAGVREPKNLMSRSAPWCPEIVAQCGGLKEDTAKVISGGPMMGFALYTLETPSPRDLRHSGAARFRSEACRQVWPVHSLRTLYRSLPDGSHAVDAQHYC